MKTSCCIHCSTDRLEVELDLRVIDDLEVESVTISIDGDAQLLPVKASASLPKTSKVEIFHILRCSTDDSGLERNRSDGSDMISDCTPAHIDATTYTILLANFLYLRDIAEVRDNSRSSTSSDAIARVWKSCGGCNLAVKYIEVSIDSRTQPLPPWLFTRSQASKRQKPTSMEGLQLTLLLSSRRYTLAAI